MGADIQAQNSFRYVFNYQKLGFPLSLYYYLIFSFFLVFDSPYGGVTILNHYKGSFKRAVMDLFPNIGLQEHFFEHASSNPLPHPPPSPLLCFVFLFIFFLFFFTD